jgi:hypothetical protein
LDEVCIIIVKVILHNSVKVWHGGLRFSDIMLGTVELGTRAICGTIFDLLEDRRGNKDILKYTNR